MKFYYGGLGWVKRRGGRMPHGGRRVLLDDPGTGRRLELNWFPPDSPWAGSCVPRGRTRSPRTLHGSSGGRGVRLEESGGKVIREPTDPLGVRQDGDFEEPGGHCVERMVWGARTTAASATPHRVRGKEARELDLRERGAGPGGAHGCAVPVSSHWRDLNPRPADYESAALPAELQWRAVSDERIRPIMVAPSTPRRARPATRSRPARGRRCPRCRRRIERAYRRSPTHDAPLATRDDGT